MTRPSSRTDSSRVLLQMLHIFNEARAGLLRLHSVALQRQRWQQSINCRRIGSSGGWLQPPPPLHILKQGTGSVQ
jgi:hypothetical protein